MEIVLLRYIALEQALSTLKDGLTEIENNSSESPKTLMLMRDGVMQRFEYCTDSLWKFLKLYLENVQKVSIESSSPRSILRKALITNLITDDEYAILMESVSQRNLTSHTYNEKIAEEIRKHIPTYYKAMHTVISRLSVS